MVLRPKGTSHNNSCAMLHNKTRWWARTLMMLFFFLALEFGGVTSHEQEKVASRVILQILRLLVSLFGHFGVLTLLKHISGLPILDKFYKSGISWSQTRNSFAVFLLWGVRGFVQFWSKTCKNTFGNWGLLPLGILGAVAWFVASISEYCCVNWYIWQRTMQVKGAWQICCTICCMHADENHAQFMHKSDSLYSRAQVFCSPAVVDIRVQYSSRKRNYVVPGNSKE